MKSVVVTNKEGTKGILKRGNTPTVLKVTINKRPLVIFRYIIKIEAIVPPSFCRTHYTIHIFLEYGDEDCVLR